MHASCRLYNALLAFRLRQYYMQHEHYMSSHTSYDALTEALTIGHFDRAIVCRVFGCDDLYATPHCCCC